VGGFSGLVQGNDWFGVSCAALGDVDGDGATDLAVGAYQADEGGFDCGAAWILFRWGGTDLPAAEFAAAPSQGPAPLSVLFTDRSAGLVTSWLWDFGDGALSSAQHPVHAYTAQGSYTVKLTVGGPLGRDELTRVRQVAAVGSGSPPVADFLCSPSSGEATLLVRFQDLSTGGATAWLWDFGDGSTSTSSSPEHAFASVGTFDVSLTVSGPGGANTKVANDLITVREPAPVAAFSATPTSGRAPLAVSFTDQSMLNVTSWRWDFGDGSTASVRNPQHAYADPGQYTVALAVTSAGGTSKLVRSNLVSVTWPPPEAAFTAGPTDGPAPLAVTFTDQSKGTISSWSWSFGDGAGSSAQHPVHVYSLPGSYKVTLKVTGPGGTATRTRPKFVTVSEPVLAAEFVGMPTSGTYPLTVNFTNQSTGSITSHAWSFGDGGTSTLASPSHTYTAAGSYTVTLTETGRGGTSTRTRASYVVVRAPAPLPLFAAAPTSGLAPLTVGFTDQSTGPITAWSWDFGDGTTSSVQHPSHAYLSSGSYTVTLTVAGPGGTRALQLPELVQVTGALPPRADFTGSPLTGAAPLTVSFQDLSSGTVTRWEWYFGDGTSSGLQNPSHVYRIPGTYSVRMRTTGPAGSSDARRFGYIRVVDPKSGVVQ
jgi:PKD repeat protein